MHLLHHLMHLLHDYGYPVIFVGLLLESTGLPLPGESLMIAAALYAATTHQLNIVILVGIAAAGAICGDQLGYGIGRWIGSRLLDRWGRKLGLSDDRRQLGRFLFRRYGAVVVFLGRFVAFLRTFVAILAGANHMAWPKFLLWNALGGACWTALYGFGAYALGDAVKHISGPLGIAMAAIAGSALLAVVIFLHRNETRLIGEARQEMQSQ